jgi:D-alanyl-lipoteichoic acid acyltransferase DltB (MBOAT superfamily)
LAAVLAGFLRGQAGQNASLANAVDIQWLGFSYLAFRLIHTLRDRQNGLLPALSLREYITYLVFFPALTAGPIDRAERFIEDFRAVGTIRGLDADRIVRAGARIAIGLFKKFVIADSLALFSLSAVSAAQAESTGALWVLLYAFAFRLYFDFSGYSDIAIGVGMLFGVQLPENFDRPYLKHTITAFWQSWHITLSNWVRFYVYSPLSRSLLRRKLLTPQKIVLVATLATMIVIGLWHGMTLSFLVWGMWHGIGLFVHKWWSDRTRKWQIQLNQQPSKLRLWRFTGVVLTFHFVVLGWVWFALPDFDTSLQVLLRLFGVN